MKRSLMKILACPVDKQYPLELYVFEEKKEQVKTGIMICPKCNRWYPIRDGIPEFLPDQFRDAKRDLLFKKRWLKKFPPKTKVHEAENK